jgi:zinc transport system ATP-binding protein
MAHSALVELKSIAYQIENKVILDKIGFSIFPKEIVSLIGPNGAGKSTLIKILVGLLQPTQGKVNLKPGITIGYTPQKMQLGSILPLTVLRFLNLVKAKRPLSEIVTELKISPTLLDTMVWNLSGGEWQRVLLARALLQKPDLLVLDEPAQGIDLMGQAELYALLRHIRDKYECGILLVSHDLHIVMAGTDRVICLQQHICCQGHPATVSKDPAFQALFGPGAKDLAVYTHQHDHNHHHDHE